MRNASDIKQELAALGAATEVGFREGPGQVSRIRELAAELEAMNPTPEPARAASLLRGRWRLLYSNLGLQRRTSMAHLSYNILPNTPIEVIELYNEIDPATGHYDNVIHFLNEDGTPGTQVLAGQYEAEDDNHLDVRFSEAIVTGPAAPVRLQANGPREAAGKTEITYLDDGFRLARGPHGSLYILERLDPTPIRWSREP
ncbi:PAP/fibrillin family protein [Sandaracinobacteroides sp. A072]|uniref:PAP/fibrillin family protein n=1 Tax=Sandaracinobacteroides sp. A072 TaxID=3461146 RepID=UPI0040416757